MDTQEMITAIVLFILSAILLLISICSFMEKGPLINNAWLWASPAEREKLDKHPHYRQSAIIFLLLAIAFASIAMHMVTSRQPVWRGISFGAVGTAIVYAIVSAVMIEKKKRANENK